MCDNWDFKESDGKFNIMEGGGGGGPIMWSEWSLGMWLGFIGMMLFVAGFFTLMLWGIWKLHQ